MNICVFKVIIIFIAFAILVAGHGMLIDPPSRSTAWRFGFKTPINYNDNELYCGGFLMSF
ncbi:hypothetical protein B4U80_08504 [Leptotrombidium deliense]|uniref:Uncharacterized protein n=1 Tax=Leptotrombidium deliense TaxID=299467 RepID=A0A443QDZ5_9ACAR|nr:hypothetical protein B4U80_08504 [Leptotrombidium deliense]